MSRVDDTHASFELFEKPLEDLQADDILKLEEREVREGLFVEYKAEPPNSRAIAKSVASFANAYGGWLLIGVDGDKENRAALFPGVDPEECSADHIRNCVVGNLAPVPRFESRLVEHQEDAGKRFVVVEVPEGDDPPYVRNDGRIYRRNGEGGDPVAENDRHALDRLFEKREKRRREIEAFFEPWSISAAEPCLQIHVLPEPRVAGAMDLFLDPSDMKQRLSRAEFPGLDETSLNGYSELPLDFVQGAHGALVFEQRAHLDSADAGIVIELGYGGGLRTSIPLPMSSPEKWEAYSSTLPGSVWDYTWLDGSSAIGPAFHVLCAHLDFLEEVAWTGNLLVKQRLVGVSQCITFCNTEEYSEYVEEFGLPICREHTIEIPRSIPACREAPDAFENDHVGFAIRHCMLMAQALGILPGDGVVAAVKSMTRCGLNHGGEASQSMSE